MPITPQTIHQQLSAAAERYRWLRGLRHLLGGGLLSLGLFICLLAWDWLFHLGKTSRWLAFATVTAPLVAGIGRWLFRALPSISVASMARRIESATAEKGNTLISVVQFDRQLPADSAFRKALFEELNDPLPRVDWARVFDLRILRRFAVGLGAVVLVLLLGALSAPEPFANSAARILLPSKSIAPLTRTRIVSITPGNSRVVHGTDVQVQIRLSGQIPKAVWISSREPHGQWQRMLMEREVGTSLFSSSFEQLRTPTSYYVEAGDAQTDTYDLSIRPKTAPIAAQARIDPPAYTKLPVQTRSDHASFKDLIPGSRVCLRLEFNHELTSLNCSELAVRSLTASTWELNGILKETTTLHLGYKDTDQIKDSETIPISVAADEPPSLVIAAPAEGELFATASDSLTITFSAKDNFGLDSVALYRTEEETPQARQQDVGAELIKKWDATGAKNLTQSVQVPLAKFIREGRVTLALVARDQNDVSGPGITWSRPIVVTIRSEQQIATQQESNNQQQKASLEMLVKLQGTNLQQTGEAVSARSVATAPTLLERQAQIADLAAQLIQTAGLAPETRSDLRDLASNDMAKAVVALRSAIAEEKNALQHLSLALRLETAILARLQGVLKSAEKEGARSRVQELIAGVEQLLRRQKELLDRSLSAPETEGHLLANEQDQLADKSVIVRKALEQAAASLGDQEFRSRLSKVVALFGESRIYEQMIAASEKLDSKALPAAAEIQKSIVAELTRLVALLNQWQLAQAQHDAADLQEAAKAMAERLKQLEQIQREIVEKSKELARQSEARPEDVATAKEMQKGKDEMAKAVEQMLTDAHVFPDLKPANELRGELTQIYEDVIQADKEEALAGTLEAKELLVQKEEGLLAAIEQATKVAEDLEMWLPNKNETTKWLMENFDKTEIPPIPNLPLPDAFEDLVGDLLQEQQGLAEQVQDAASNNAMAQAQQGWEVADGPMPGFSAQGKSGNTRPNKNEQTGRSSGGREGMSNGEMAGDTASTLEGTTPDVRRTNDPLQQGQIRDDGGIQQARATGGGKAGGFSDRQGMDGEAPVRASNAPRMAAPDAMAVQQALLAEKTSKAYARASLLYLRANGMPEAVRLMDESREALAQNRMEDFRALHQRIVAKLTDIKGAILPGNVVTVSSETSKAAKETQLLGGEEGQAPPAYKKAVSDYYKAIQQ